MSNLSIHFSYPWLLLLLIPAFALALIPYFRLSKRYRRTRNRIVSVVTHLCVCVLSICILCGIEFRYVKTNTENEILILVDVSDTQEWAQSRRDDLVKNVLDDGRYDGYKMGVVTFGFTQNYAVPLTYETEDIFDLYLNAELPDTSATNLEGALKYAKELFTHPESSKVLLITDGRETDGNALAAIRALTAQGTKVDTAYISEDFEENDVQVLGIDLPITHVKPGDFCTLKVSLRSRVNTTGTRVVLKDNGVKIAEDGEKIVDLSVGENEVTYTHAFDDYGLHKITAQVIENTDKLESNDEYTTYLYLQTFNRVLIIDQNANESLKLAQILTDGDKFSLDTATISGETLKTKGGIELTSVKEFRRFDQVIMNNVSNSDVAKVKGLEDNLYSYVHDYGGGLFTLGGEKEGTAHAYNRKDLKDSKKYQELLPVQAIDYTPPVGVVICVDRSGSMNTDNNLAKAVNGLQSCYDALSERDYIGILTLDKEYGVILPLTPTTNDMEIARAIDSDKLKTATGSTEFFKAIQKAGEMLQANKQVEKKHIIIVSDGMMTDKAQDSITEAAKLAAKGISISVVLIGEPGTTVKENMGSIVGPSRGRVTWNSSKSLTNLMRDELVAKKVEESRQKDYYPLVKTPTSAIFSGVEYGIETKPDEDDEETDIRNASRMQVKLGGFYGVKKKDGAEVILTADYDVAPLFAQWKFGKGMVGSFMCDLSGLKRSNGDPSWSADFMADGNAQKLIRNIVDNLMPVEDISPAAFEYSLNESNYTNTLRVYSDLKDGETLQGKIETEIGGENVSVLLNEVSEGKDVYVTVPFSKTNQFSRCEFVAKTPGVYKITLVKCNANGEPIEHQQVEIYKSVTFSEEYDLYGEEEETCKKLLSQVAKNGNGKVIEDITDPREVFESFTTGIDKKFDPRYVFAILAIVLFLTDIAVRKFKFKWLHEIIRSKKKKSQS